ncbi:MAG TPA: AsmA-like C-terminal region-containing protein, partial [Aquella sp.]|nr:AsmA-like C-terminal region-containing protein [Aquella sp.]
ILQGLANVKVQNFDKPVYTGNIDLPTFSLNELMAKLAMAPIDIPNKQLFNRVNLKTNFSTTGNSINLSNLSSQISDSTLSGSVNISSIKPLNISENIRINKLNVEDFIETNGYKVPLSGIAANGSLTNSGADLKSMAGVSANQNIMVDNVTVLGLDLNKLFAQFDSVLSNTVKAIEVQNLQSITHTTQAIQAVQNMKDIAARAKASGAKNYNERTNLGTLQSNMVMHNGIANPSTFKLSGPTIKADGKGSINMVDKSLNYNIAVQIVTPQKNQILNKLIFPYQVHGKFNNLEGGVDWMSIQTQIIPLLVNEAVSQAKSVVKEQLNKQVDTLIKGSSPQVQQNSDTIKKGAANLINNIFK